MLDAIERRPPSEIRADAGDAPAPAVAPGAGLSTLEAVVRQADTAIGVVHADGSFGLLTEAIERITGITASEYTGRAFDDYVHPDDMESFRPAMAELLRRGDGSAASVRVRIRTVDGGWRWVDMVVTRALQVPGVNGLVASVRDAHADQQRISELEHSERKAQESVEELRRQERALLALLGGSADAVVVLDRQGSIAWVSPGIETVSGWTTAEITDQIPRELVHPEDVDELSRAVAGVLESPPAGQGAPQPEPITIRLLSADGEYRWVAVTVRDLRHVPEVDGVTIAVRDVHDRMTERLLTEASERRFRALVEHGSDVVFTFDENLTVTYVTDSVRDVLGYTVEQCLGRRAFAIVTGDDRVAIEDMVERLADQPGGTEQLRIRVHRADGRTIWAEVRVTNHLDRPEVAGWVCVFWDVTARVQAEEENRRLLDIFDRTEDHVVLVDAEGRLIYMNAAGRRFHRMSEEEVEARRGLPWPHIIDFGGQEPDSFATDFDGWSGEVLTGRLHELPGEPMTPVWLQISAHRDADGRVEYFSAVARDMSERKQFEDSLARQATHDPLTGLPNRVLLFERITSAVEGLREVGHAQQVALLFIDIDHFKVINDSLGHALGDRLLQGIGERIRAAVRPGDTVGRFGGDEFVVLCERLERPEDAVAIAHRVEVTLQMPFNEDGHEIHAGVSIGIAFVDPSDPDPQAVLRDADTAMYRAKSEGRGRWVMFDDELRRQAVDRQRIETALRHSRHGEELELHYQPVVSLADGRVVGAEALLRWRHGDRLVPPDEFIPVAEETGLIVPIGDWVLREACAQMARWQALPGWSHLGLSVNVSARQLQHPGFVAALAAALHDSDLRPGTLSIELTETVVLEDVPKSRDRLERIKALGVSIAVDDFGTGYSSLIYLHELPIDIVKLDRSFVAGVGLNRRENAIVTAVLDLASALGLYSVAEGIEEPAQLEQLRDLGCTCGQGFLLARPMDAEAMSELLADPDLRLPATPSRSMT